MAVELHVGGNVVTGFSSGRVQLTMAGAYNSFDVEYLADGRDSDDERLIFPGDVCKLVIDGETVLDGYVDDVEDDDTPDEVRLRAVGRSRTADLADCSSLFTPGSWKNTKLNRIADDVAMPFQIATFLQGDPGEPFAAFSVQKGETAYDTIARAALKRGFHVYTVGGELILARAGDRETATVLERGSNLLRATRHDSHVARFSDYVLKAQAKPTEARWGKYSSQLTHTVQDIVIQRYRPLLIQAEAHSGFDLQRQAEIERNQRAARGERITCLVDGYHTDEGTVWRPNLLVPFKSRTLGIDATLLVVTARFNFGADEAHETELELADPAGWRIDTAPAKRGRGDPWT